MISQSKIGDSIAVNGCCLTVVEIDGDTATFTLMMETLRRTTFVQKAPSERVHVERSASLQDVVDGHPISGHISGTVILRKKEYLRDGSLIMIFTLPNAPSFLTEKGSVAIDGVSLTVASLEKDSFSVSLIPHTQKVTLLSEGTVGSVYNVEANGTFPTSVPSDPMELALRTSLLGRITAPSNPWVGAVITDQSGAILATGFHRKRGERHAEVDAISKLVSGEGHTLYCTLEPCNHTGLQPPCTEAILKSAVQRVIVGILDPDIRVSGSGVARLRNAGIEVIVLGDQRVSRSLRSYIIHRQTKRPYVIAKMAISLDGKIAPEGTSSQFPISGPESREHSHILRLKSQAILVGATTAAVDKPRLNVRLPESSKYYADSKEHRPLRCFIDVRGRVVDGPLLDTTIGPTLVFTDPTICRSETLALWKEREVQIFSLSTVDRKVVLTEILDELGKRGVLTLLVEGGSRLFTSFVEADLIDQIVIYLAPVLLGAGVPLFSGSPVNRYHQESAKSKGNDIVVKYRRL